MLRRDKINARVGGVRPDPGPGLPERVARRINPDILAERQRRIEARLADDARSRLLRRRCAEIVANYLLESTSHADANHRTAA